MRIDLPNRSVNHYPNFQLKNTHTQTSMKFYVLHSIFSLYWWFYDYIAKNILKQKIPWFPNTARYWKDFIVFMQSVDCSLMFHKRIEMSKWERSETACQRCYLSNKLLKLAKLIEDIVIEQLKHQIITIEPKCIAIIRNNLKISS